MADVDIDPFGNHDKTESHPDDTGETIPFTPEGVIEGGSTWQGCHFPDSIKFPDFSLTFPGQD